MRFWVKRDLDDQPSGVGSLLDVGLEGVAGDGVGVERRISQQQVEGYYQFPGLARTHALHFEDQFDRLATRRVLLECGRLTMPLIHMAHLAFPGPLNRRWF